MLGYITRMDGPIKIEQKEYEFIRCGIHYKT